ncbi:MAG: ABC transporter permease [Phycisphaerales bacterium]|nr:ABC transporter permease [Phycisphaerales bacterium]
MQLDTSLTGIEIGFLVTLTALSVAAWRLKTPAVWPLIALTILALFNALYTPNFFVFTWMDSHLYGTAIDVLNNGAYVMLLAFGMTLVIATGGVDLSVGAVMAISAAAAAVLLHDYDNMSLIVVLALPLVLSILAGAWNGLLVTVFRIQPLVATLVLMVSGRGLAMQITQAQQPSVPRQYEAFAFIGNGFLFTLPFAVTIVIVMFGATLWLTRKTAIGMFIESVGDNDTASRYAGVNARGVKLLVYTFSGLCAGIAGIIHVSNNMGTSPATTGQYFELDAIMAVVIGGTALTGGRFSLLGSLVGALLIQALTTTMLAHGLSSHEVLVPKAIVIVVVCLLQAPEFHRKLKNLVGPKRKRRVSA